MQSYGAGTRHQPYLARVRPGIRRRSGRRYGDDGNGGECALHPGPRGGNGGSGNERSVPGRTGGRAPGRRIGADRLCAGALTCDQAVFTNYRKPSPQAIPATPSTPARIPSHHDALPTFSSKRRLRLFVFTQTRRATSLSRVSIFREPMLNLPQRRRRDHARVVQGVIHRARIAHR